MNRILSILMTFLLIGLLAACSSDSNDVSPEDIDSSTTIKQLSMWSTNSTFEIGIDNLLKEFLYDDNGLLIQIKHHHKSSDERYNKRIEIDYNENREPVRIEEWEFSESTGTFKKVSQADIVWLDNGFEIDGGNGFEGRVTLDSKNRISKIYDLSGVLMKSYEYNTSGDFTVSFWDYQTHELDFVDSYKVSTSKNPFRDINVAIVVAEGLQVENEMESPIIGEFAISEYSGWTEDLIRIAYTEDIDNHIESSAVFWGANDNSPEYMYYKYEVVKK